MVVEVVVVVVVVVVVAVVVVVVVAAAAVVVVVVVVCVCSSNSTVCEEFRSVIWKRLPFSLAILVSPTIFWTKIATKICQAILESWSPKRKLVGEQAGQGARGGEQDC